MLEVIILCYQLDVPVIVKLGLIYMPVSVHRRQDSPHKSWWDIKMDEEIACFLQANALSTLIAGSGWAVHLGGGTRPTTLGYRWKGGKAFPLVVAKFVNKNESLGPWHGYPADYQDKPQDLPPVNVLQRWADEGFIRRHEVTRIRRGIKCF